MGMFVTKGLIISRISSILLEPLSPLAAIRAHSGSMETLVSTTLLYMFKQRNQDPSELLLGFNVQVISAKMSSAP